MPLSSKTVLGFRTEDEAVRAGALIGETPTPGYNDLRAELSYRVKTAATAFGTMSEVLGGIAGSNLLNQAIRNSVSYTKDEVLMPGANVRVFATVKF